METEHKNVRLDFSSLVPLFFVVGFGAGILFIPFSVVEFFEQDLLVGIAAVVLTPLVNGLAAVAFLFCGFPIYALIARKRNGYTVRLVQISASHNKQCS